MEYKPSYVWPNPAFPFRLYFDHPLCRIFIIENIHHNWDWLSVFHSKFRHTDQFLVLCGWHHSKQFAVEANELFLTLNLKKQQFFFLYNSQDEKLNFEQFGFIGDIYPQNSWLDENLVMRPVDTPKIYRAVYVGRRSAFKRHMLASKVDGLALVAGINHGNQIAPVPKHVYINSDQLTPEEVCLKINQSHCGLILSEVEGACYASSEYLLCGIPVVSTKSFGGRDIWYNSYNSIVCNPNEKEIAEAVSFFNNNPRDPKIIRNAHIELANYHRKRFIGLLEKILSKNNITNLNMSEFFKDNFFHKMRKSYKPELNKIFQ